MSLIKKETRQQTAWNEYPVAANFDSLPPADTNAGQINVVLNSSGVWFVNYHEAGLYRSNGVVWQHLGSQVEMTSIQVGNTTVVGSPVIFNEGPNIDIAVDLPTKTITISATAADSRQEQTENGTLERNLSGQIAAVHKPSGSVILLRDENGTLTGVQKTTEQINFVRNASGKITGWNVTER